MTKSTTATNIKELGLNSKVVKQISKMYNGDAKTTGIGARSIAETLGLSRRVVMRALEINGDASFSPGSYA
jgi:hypothetical protein